MSDTHYGVEARLLELELESNARAVRQQHRALATADPAVRRSTRRRVAARLRQAAALLDG